MLHNFKFDKTIFEDGRQKKNFHGLSISLTNQNERNSNEQCEDNQESTSLKQID